MLCGAKAWGISSGAANTMMGRCGKGVGAFQAWEDVKLPRGPDEGRRGRLLRAEESGRGWRRRGRGPRWWWRDISEGQLVSGGRTS